MKFLKGLIIISAILDIPVYLLWIYVRTGCGDVCPINRSTSSSWLPEIIIFSYILIFLVYFYIDSNEEKFPQTAATVAVITAIIFIAPLLTLGLKYLFLGA